MARPCLTKLHLELTSSMQRDRSWVLVDLVEEPCPPPLADGRLKPPLINLFATRSKKMRARERERQGGSERMGIRSLCNCKTNYSAASRASRGITPVSPLGHESGTQASASPGVQFQVPDNPAKQILEKAERQDSLHPIVGSREFFRSTEWDRAGISETPETDRTRSGFLLADQPPPPFNYKLNRRQEEPAVCC